MDELLDRIDVYPHDRPADIADKLCDELVGELDHSDEPITGDETEWAETVTRADVSQILEARLNGPDSVSFVSASKYDDINFRRPYNKTEVDVEVINDYEARGTYEITCPTCFGVGDYDKMHGRNAYMKCASCGTGITF